MIGKDKSLGSHRQKARARVSERDIYENVFILEQKEGTSRKCSNYQAPFINNPGKSIKFIDY